MPEPSSFDESPWNFDSPVENNTFPTENRICAKGKAVSLSRLAHYQILRRLGAGGMGEVFEAQDTRLGRRVAIKVMLTKIASSKTSRERFLREARAAAAVKHDNIVTIYEVGEDRDRPYIALEYLEGEPLDVWLKRHPQPALKSALRMGREIASGLAAAHAKGLVHRDIKPANLWIEATSSRIKILDFGLARLASDKSELTQQGAIVGTPAYMAPEQADGQPCDYRADLFSLGIVLYRLCTGRMPFPGSTTLAILQSLATVTPVKVREVNPQTPIALSNLIHQLLQKKPQDRPASADEVFKTLSRIERIASATDPEPAAASVESATAIHLPSKVKKRKTALLAACGIGLLSLVAAAGAWSMGWGNRSREVAIPPQIPKAVPPAAAQAPVVTDDDRAVAAVLHPYFSLSLSADSGIKYCTPADNLPAERFVIFRIYNQYTGNKSQLPEALRGKSFVNLVSQLRHCSSFDLFSGVMPLEVKDFQLFAGTPFGDRLKNLTYVQKDQLSHDWVDNLRNFPSLHSMDFKVSRTDDQLFDRIRELRALGTLRLIDFPSSQISHKQFVETLSKSKITYLRAHFGTGQKGQDWARSIAQIRPLTHLCLEPNSRGVDDAFCFGLKGATLSSLLIKESRITDAGLEALKELPFLKKVQIEKSSITFDGVANLRRSRPDITVRTDKTLDISRLGLIKAENLGSLLKQPHAMSELRLDLSKATDDMVAKLAAFQELKTLTCVGIGESSLTERGIEAIASLPIEEIRIEYLGKILMPYWIKHASKMVNLRTYIRFGVRDAELKAISKCPKLSTIIFSGRGEISDEGLKTLEGMTNLKAIDLSDSPVTIEGLRKLRAARPDLNVLHKELSGFDRDAGFPELDVDPGRAD